MTPFQLEQVKLDWLYYFVVLAEAGSFSLAAKQLFISQQALSKMLAQFEKQLQTPLLERHPWRLTPAGEQWLNKAQAVLAQVNQIEQLYLGSGEENWQKPLALAVTAYCNPAFVESLKQLCLRHRDLKLELKTHLSQAETEAQLLNGQLDLALTPTEPQNKLLRSRFYKSSPFILVAKPTPQFEAPWQNLDFIACRAPAPLDSLLSWPAAYPRTVVAEAELGTAVALAVAGQGALWIPKNAVCLHLRSGSLKRLADPPFQRHLDLHLVWAHSRQLRPVLRQALEYLLAR